MLISSEAYRQSLRRYKPRVTVDGRPVESVADEPMFAPGIAAVGVTYDFALDTQFERIMTAIQRSSGRRVNRMLHVNETADDLLDKLEAMRLTCREAGCAQRYIAQDMLNALYQATRRCDANRGTDYHVARTGGRVVVAWEVKGHTCVLSAPASVGADALLRLAWWRA